MHHFFLTIAKTASEHVINAQIYFSNFSCMFLNPNIFFPIWIVIVVIY